MLTAKPRFPVREILLFGLLPSFIKKFVYRLRGYRIGRGVSFGIGSVIEGDEIDLGDYVSIGFFTIIRGRKINIAAHVQIGALTFLDTPYLELGEGTKINEQVFVGGLQFPDSRLVVGRNCQIMQMTFINPTRTITIGDDSGIGGDCLLFGHSSWLSQFEGYPIEFDSIEIGKSVSLAWRVFVLPGTKILDGAVVGANSLVRGEIPSRCLAVGFPARVVAKAPDFPKPVSDDDKRQILLNIQKEFVAYLRDSGFVCREEGSILTVSELTGRRWFRKARQWRMVITGSGLKVLKDTDADVVVSLWAIPGESRKSLSKSGIMWIDLENKERPDSGNELGEEFAQYLKRYGVRLIRIK